MLLETRADAAPHDGGAFMVLDRTLSVCALSAAAERLLAARETEAVNRHVTELLVPADAEAQGPASLAAAVTWAASGDETRAPSPCVRRTPSGFASRPGSRAAVRPGRRCSFSTARRASRTAPTRKFLPLHVGAHPACQLALLAQSSEYLDNTLHMNGIRTNAAAVMLGVSPNTLRSWERRYGFPTAAALARRSPPVLAGARSRRCG